MGEKTWRISEYEFYKRADEFLEKRLREINESVKTMAPGEHRKEVEKIMIELKTAHKINEPIDVIRQIEAKLVCAYGRDWHTFSMKRKEKPEDIIFMILMNNIFGTPFVAYTYICEFSELSEELIEDILFIESELFGFSYWDDKHVSCVCSLIQNGEDNTNHLKDLYKLQEEENGYSEDFKNKCEKLINTLQKQKNLKIKSAEHAIFNNTKQTENLINNIQALKNRQIVLIRDFIKTVEKDMPKKYYKDMLDKLSEELENLIPGFPNKEFFKLWMSSKGANIDYAYITSLPSVCEKHIETLQKGMKNTIKMEKVLLEKLKIAKRTVTEFSFNNRLDWYFINNNQKLSHEFRKKYSCLMNNQHKI